MYLLIFESLGTSELILIGIVALIFLGPRKLPEIARKIGRVMADLRGSANEFKSTWEREVDFEEEAKALRIDLLEESAPVARDNSILAGDVDIVTAPEIKTIDRERFEALAAEAGPPVNSENGHKEDEAEDEPDLLSDKRTWL